MKVLHKPVTLDRTALVERYRNNRRRSRTLFSLVREAMYKQPLELRHPFIFYLGHIPAFHFNTLARRAFNLPSCNERFDSLFRRGIDPETSAGAQAGRSHWPAVDDVTAYANEIDRIIESLFHERVLDDSANRYLDRAQAVFTILEHEEMHQETLVYIMNRLDDAHKSSDGMAPVLPASSQRLSERIAIPPGRVTLGSRVEDIAFGWDNEFSAMTVDVAAFELESFPVTNGQYLRFIEREVAAAPISWVQTERGWMQRTMRGLVPLQTEWPAYVSLDAAQTYARAYGARVMTEPEFHRAAFGDPSGRERTMPWGSAAADGNHGNFGFRRYDPEPVGLSPAGASAWGVFELVGNGWEWTSSDFSPLPGFSPMASYPEYSADFFDGKHAVIKGASPVTSTALLRPSLRNWFRRDYPYAYTKFRLAY